jgi:cytosine permease
MTSNQLKQSWLTLGCLQLSGALSLPVIMIGYYLRQHGSLQQSLCQLLTGNLILFGLSAFYLLLINQKKMTTIEFAQHLFGRTGTTLCAVGMVLSLIGWSAIQINLISVAMGHNSYMLNLLIALVIYVFTRKDLAYLAGINKRLLPIICLCFCTILISASKTPLTHATIPHTSFSLGFVMIITAGSGLVFDLPTFYRHAATPKDGLLGLVFIFGLALPVVEGAGIYLATHSALTTDSNDWVNHFIQHFNVFSLFFLMLSGLLGTCLNLYSASIIINRTVKITYQQALLFCSVLAATMALINLEKHFSLFLEIINLNAEVITILLFMYVVFKGYRLPEPNPSQKKLHQRIFYLTILYAIGSKLFQLNLLHDLFLETAIMAFFAMIICYSLPDFITKKNCLNGEKI